MGVGENIKRRRLELHLSQQELADMMGYKTRSSIAKIECGENDVTQKKLKKFAIALETTVAELVSGEQPMVSRVRSAVKARAHKTIAVVLAGGDGGQNRQNIPTQFLMVKGQPIVGYSLNVYERHPLIDEIYVVCVKGWERLVENYAVQCNITKLKDIIPASSSGILSLKNAFDYLKDDCAAEDVIVVQEATRPRINADIVSKLLQVCFETGSTVLCHPMHDYVQFNIAGEQATYINRQDVVALQSPEAHRFSLLKDMFETAEKTGHALTESCCTMLLYNLGYTINFLDNSINNAKLSGEEDVISFAAYVRDK